MIGAVWAGRPARLSLGWERKFGAGRQQEAECQQHAAAGHAHATHPKLITHSWSNERSLVEQRTSLGSTPPPRAHAAGAGLASRASNAELVAFGVGELEPAQAVLVVRLFLQALGSERLESSGL